MKPVMIVPPGVLSDADVQLLRENDLCVVVADDPSKVRFVDPIPAMSSRTEIENAAIQLSRKLLNGNGFDQNGVIGQRGVASLYVNLLVKGTPLQHGQTQAEKDAEEREFARVQELRRLGREDAKAEHEAKKAAKAASKGTNP